MQHFTATRFVNKRWRDCVLLGAILFSVSSCYAQRGTVGAQFGRDPDGHVYVRDVPPGLGAANAGIRDGDEVILIEGRDVRGLSDVDIHRLLSGDRGTYVRLTLIRGDQVVRTTVERTPPPSGPVSTLNH